MSDYSNDNYLNSTLMASHALENELKSIIRQTPELMESAEACNSVKLPNYYIAGGAITQLIWNLLSGNKPLDNVKDLDIVYFDSIGKTSEEGYQNQIRDMVKHDIPIDVVNQARVHEWYPKKFGQSIEPYVRVEQGIESWLSAFAIGFRLTSNDLISLYLPYGLHDAFSKKVTPNPIAMTSQNYNKMVAGYRDRWPDITIEAWDELK